METTDRWRAMAKGNDFVAKGMYNLRRLRSAGEETAKAVPVEAMRTEPLSYVVWDNATAI